MKSLFAIGAVTLVAAAALAGVAKAEPIGPSLNCMYARYPDEVAICHDGDLSMKDRNLATAYFDFLANNHYGYRAYLQRTQAAWLNERHRCGYNFVCIDDAYNRRLDDFFAEDDLQNWCTAGHMRDLDCDPRKFKS